MVDPVDGYRYLVTGRILITHYHTQIRNPQSDDYIPWEKMVPITLRFYDLAAARDFVSSNERRGKGLHIWRLVE